MSLDLALFYASSLLSVVSDIEDYILNDDVENILLLAAL
jgi:hypothetical protein